MAVHFILDGYNIIKQHPSLANLKLQDGREGLVRIIENQRPQGSLRNDVTIVFDGRSGVYGFPQASESVRVIFSQETSADERIKDMVVQEKNRKSLTVVTDDRAIQYYVRALGAKACKVAEFMGRGRPEGPVVSRPRRARGSSSGRKGIPGALESKITQELSEVWLKKKPGKKKT